MIKLVFYILWAVMVAMLVHAVRRFHVDLRGSTYFYACFCVRTGDKIEKTKLRKMADQIWYRLSGRFPQEYLFRPIRRKDQIADDANSLK